MLQPLDTAALHDLVARFQAGDRLALDALIRRTADRLGRLAEAMLRGYPGVRAREEPGDVVQNALLRLTRALAAVTPASVRDYYRLAAELIRRELIDLARRHARRPAEPLDPAAGPDPAEPAEHLDRWAAFQEAVERLPADRREVFGLVFYHRWGTRQVADLLQVSDRQVRRLLADAGRRLRAELGADVPGD